MIDMIRNDNEKYAHCYGENDTEYIECELITNDVIESLANDRSEHESDTYC
jgi:hypothetical protein